MKINALTKRKCIDYAMTLLWQGYYFELMTKQKVLKSLHLLKSEQN